MLALLGVLDKLMVEEGMNQAPAGAVLKVKKTGLSYFPDQPKEW